MLRWDTLSHFIPTLLMRLSLFLLISHCIARNTQIYIQSETEVCREVDAWAGSYYVETLTYELVHKAWALYPRD